MRKAKTVCTETGTKQCRRCKQTLPLSSFLVVTKKNGNTALKSECRKCNADRAKIWRTKKGAGDGKERRHTNNRPGFRWCARCSSDLKTSEFYSWNRAKDGKLVFSCYCVCCSRKLNEQYLRKQGVKPRETVKVPEGLKWCNDCKTARPVSDFGLRSDRPSGVQSRCKSCMSAKVRKWSKETNYSRSPQRRAYLDTHREERNKQFRMKRVSNPEKIMDSRLRTTWGISLDQYNKLLDKQGGVCAICKLPETHMVKGTVCRLAVDHDHSCCSGCFSCGKCIRGLLCHRCNSMLGYAKDSVNVLQSMAQYLQNFEEGASANAAAAG